MVRRSRRKKGARKTINRWKILLHVTRRWPARVTCIDARVPAPGGGLGRREEGGDVPDNGGANNGQHEASPETMRRRLQATPPPRSLNQRSTYNKTATRNFNESRFSFISSASAFPRPLPRGGRERRVLFTVSKAHEDRARRSPDNCVHRVKGTLPRGQILASAWIMITGREEGVSGREVGTPLESSRFMQHWFMQMRDVHDGLTRDFFFGTRDRWGMKNEGRVVFNLGLFEFLWFNFSFRFQPRNDFFLFVNDLFELLQVNNACTG